MIDIPVNTLNIFVPNVMQRRGIMEDSILETVYDSVKLLHKAGLASEEEFQEMKDIVFDQSDDGDRT